MMVFGAVDFGRLFYAYVAVASAAREGAAYAGRFYAPDTQVTAQTLATVVTDESGGFLVAAAGGNTTVVGPTLVAAPLKVPMVQVGVTYTFRPLVPLPMRGPILVGATAAAPLPGNVL
jgi:hypothetical protein